MKIGKQNQEIGIVVPTLGERDDYLTECLKSIRSEGNAYVCVVAPPSVNLARWITEGLIDQVVTDPGKGLPAAINCGFSALPDEIKYINWLGDDDRLVPGSLEIASQALSDNRYKFVFGSCDYIDSKGELIGKNRSGRWAMWLMKYGPDLVPQPGSLYRRSAFDSVGGLDTTLGWAFDLDLFLRFEQSVSWRYIPDCLAQYRWHDATLSTGRRAEMIAEARSVRSRYHGSAVRAAAPMWEAPTAIAVNLAGIAVSRYSRFRQRNRSRK